uniref:MmcB family DNA repair protein n=1 Tax=uncultured Erythrobacter sp. TaxID=263913 RepID=UPI0026023A4B|nr:MmcB family DNA repair protein [uncultured Erythrobacter sp.]
MNGSASQTLDSPATAQDVARGVMRLFARNDIWCLSEVPLKNGRRADLMGIDAKGLVVIVEIKVARGDLLGDAKWPDYLDYCDRFFWGVPPSLDRTPLDTEAYQPDACGVIVGDGYDAEILRHAPLAPLAAARRKVQVERLARIAMRRHTATLDPHCSDHVVAG